MEDKYMEDKYMEDKYMTVGKLVSVMVCLLLVCTVVPAGAADLKVAYVDLQKCIDNSAAGIQAKKELEDVVKAKQVKIDELGKEIDEAKSNFERQTQLLTPEAKKSKQEDIERRIRDYKRLVKDSQDDLQKEESTMTGKVIEKIRVAVEKVGSEEGYGFIFEKNSSGILFSSDAYDISDHVLETMNSAGK